MNDLEKLIEVLKAFGLEEEINKNIDRFYYTITKEKDGSTNLSTGEGRGYSGFGASFYFDENGKAIDKGFGVWE